MNAGSLFCARCGGFELVRAKRPRCAQCGGRRILTAGTLRAAVASHRRGQIKDPLWEAVRRLLIESGASWPSRRA